MEEAKGAFRVRVPQEEEEAVDGVDGAVVPEERDPGAGQGSVSRLRKRVWPRRLGWPG